MVKNSTKFNESFSLKSYYGRYLYLNSFKGY